MDKRELRSSESAPATWSLRALFTILVLGLCAGVQLADNGVQSLSLDVIQTSFAVNDKALGAVQGLAGFFFGSLIAIPFSRLVDKFSRKRIFLCLILASSSMTVLSALAPNFMVFFVGRSSAGILEFAMIPLVYSMIPDLAPERDRVFANLSFAAIMAAGASGGFYFGASIIAAGEHLLTVDIDAWRKGFLLMSVSSPLLLLLACFTQDPLRYLGAKRAPSDSIVDFLKRQWKPSVLFLGAVGFMLIAVQALSQLVSLAMQRQFDAEIALIGQAMGVILLIVSFGSIPMAGLLDRAVTKPLGKASRPAVIALAAITALPVSILLILSSRLDHAFIAIGAFLFVTATANALVPTMLQDLVPNLLRARAFAIWSFLISIFSALGPLIAATLSDLAFHGNMLTAITFTTIPALILSAVFALLLVAKMHNKIWPGSRN